MPVAEDLRADRADDRVLAEFGRVVLRERLELILVAELASGHGHAEVGETHGERRRLPLAGLDAQRRRGAIVNLQPEEAVVLDEEIRGNASSGADQVTRGDETPVDHAHRNATAERWIVGNGHRRDCQHRDGDCALDGCRVRRRGRSSAPCLSAWPTGDLVEGERLELHRGVELDVVRHAHGGRYEVTPSA